MSAVALAISGNQNANLNAEGSVYAKTYGHAKSDLVSRAMAGRKKKKIYDASPKQLRP